MMKKTGFAIFSAFLLIIFSGTLYWAKADDHRHRENRSEHHGKDDSRHESYMKTIDNPVYKAECGSCHFAYQPELLPSTSWTKILGSLGNHFGETVELDENSGKVIAAYLESNSAEKSSAKRAVKIMRSLGKQVPLRITDIPYIREKHHKISPNILMRKSIGGSLSNCAACHTTAESGIYDDDNVKIPD